MDWSSVHFTTIYRILGEELAECEVVGLDELGIEINRKLIYPQRCFNNALALVQTISGCEYVEGEVVVEVKNQKFPIVHAWNYCQGKYFDATFALCNSGIKANYFPVVRGSVSEILEQGYNFNHIDLVTQYMNRPENRRKYYDLHHQHRNN